MRVGPFESPDLPVPRPPCAIEELKAASADGKSNTWPHICSANIYRSPASKSKCPSGIRCRKRYPPVLKAKYRQGTSRARAGNFYLSLIHISEPTRQAEISYAVF